MRPTIRHLDAHPLRTTQAYSETPDFAHVAMMSASLEHLFTRDICPICGWPSQPGHSRYEHAAKHLVAAGWRLTDEPRPAPTFQED